MENIFLHLLSMSLSAGLLVVAVLLLRLAFHRAPRWIHCLLWTLVAVRLLCPVTLESSFSLMPDTKAAVSAVSDQLSAPQDDVPDTPTGNNSAADTPVTDTPPVDSPVVDTPIVTPPAIDIPVVDDPVTDAPTATPTPQVSVSAPTPEASVDPWQIAVVIATYVWLAGMAAMAIYAAVTTWRLRRRVREAARITDRVWCCDHIRTPFILGVFRPRIYLPSDLSGAARDSVLAHEQAHLHRRDHWWKPLGFILLAVYWFNPLMWVAYVLLCRDIEAACDERVVRDMNATDRKVYSEALLLCSVPRRLISACPLAFGETGVKSRIKSVLNYKKPTVWIIVAALLISTVAGVCLLTDPKSKDPDKQASVSTDDDATSDSDSDTTNDDHTDPMGSVNVISTGEPLYDALLQSVAGYHQVLDSSVQEPDCSLMIWQHAHLSELGIQLTDLDNNGQNELLISAMDWPDGVTPFVYDVYTIKDGKLAHLLSSGERSRYYLREDGYVEHQWSGGAAVSGTDFYRLADGALTFLERVTYDDEYAVEIGLADSLASITEGFWFHSTHVPDGNKGDYASITKQEAQSIIEASTTAHPLLKVNFVPLDSNPADVPPTTSPEYAVFVHNGKPQAEITLELDGNRCTYTNSILSSWVAAEGTYEVKGDSIVLSFPNDAMTIEFEGDFTGLKLCMGQSDTRMSYEQMSFGNEQLKDGAVFQRIVNASDVSYTSETFYSQNWLSEALRQEMREKYQYRTGNYSDKDWPIIPITSRAELDAFFATYENDVSDFGFATADTSAYDDAFFAEKMLLAVYYRNGSSSIKPKIAAVEYNGAELVTVQVDIYEPSVKNAMLGQWFMLAEVSLDEIPYATAYRAVERDHIPTEYYWATYTHPVTVGDEDTVTVGRYSIFQYGRETLSALVESLTWYGAEMDHSDFSAIGYFCLDGGKEYYVSADGNFLYDGAWIAALTAEDYLQLGSYLRDGNPGEKAATASLTGTMVEWSKEGYYMLLEITDGDSKLGDRVKVSTRIMPPGSAPEKNASVTVFYDGYYEEGYIPTIYALYRTTGGYADQVGGPDDPGPVLDEHTFVGKVTQVWDSGVLMECYETEKFDTVWVGLSNYPDLQPQVGEEYVITYNGEVQETYPPEVTAELITLVSSTPTVPTDTTEPTDVTDPTNSTDTTNSTDPTGATNPTGVTSSTGTTNPTGTTNSTGPTNSTGTTNSIDTTNSTGTNSSTKPTTPTVTTKPTTSTKPTTTTKSTTSTKPTTGTTKPTVPTVTGPHAVSYVASRTFFSYGTLSEERIDGLYKRYAYDNSSQDLPIIPITSRTELNAFIEEYKSNFRGGYGLPSLETLSVYSDDFFSNRMLLAVYYWYHSAQAYPQIVAMDYDGKGLVTVQLDIHLPEVMNDAVSHNFVLAEVPRAQVANADFRAVVREEKYVYYRWQNYTHPVMAGSGDEFVGSTYGSGWIDGTPWQLVRYITWRQAESSSFKTLGYFSMGDGKRYYVSPDGTTLFDGERIATLNAEQTAMMAEYIRGVAPVKADTYVTGKLVEWNKASGYMTLEVTKGASALGKRVRVYTQLMSISNSPTVGDTIAIAYDGFYEVGSSFTTIYGLFLVGDGNDYIDQGYDDGNIPQTQTNLEFWIAENVHQFDFSGYQEKYGLFGGTEYYGTGYVPTMDGDYPIDPERCVIYTVTSYPDYADIEQHVTAIHITDPNIYFYGISLESSFAEFDAALKKQGFQITSSGKTAHVAKKGKCTITMTQEYIRIMVEVENRTGIVF